MKILSIGSDRKLFAEGSAVSERIKEYGSLVEELHIVNMTDAREGFKDKQLAPNVWVYPTNSIFSIFRPLDAARIGKRLILDKKFVRGQSVITAQDIESGWAGMKVKSKWRIPLEVQLHTDPFSPYFKGFQNSVRKMFIGKILRAADSIRVVGESLKSKILNIRPDATISVLPIYVDKRKIEDARLSFDLHARYPWHFILLAVSRLAPEKNLSLAIDALAMVRSRFPDTGLVIVGSGPEEGRLKSLVKKLKLEGAVEFAGWQEDLASFYKTSNLFIQCSFFEGYGLALVEAGLSGLPVVTTPVGVAAELEDGRDARILPIGRVDLFAEAIIDLIEHNDKRENLRFNLKKTLESKLLSKEQYLNTLKENWEVLSKKIY